MILYFRCKSEERDQAQQDSAKKKEFDPDSSRTAGKPVRGILGAFSQVYNKLRGRNPPGNEVPSVIKSPPSSEDPGGENRENSGEDRDRENSENRSQETVSLAPSPSSSARKSKLINDLNAKDQSSIQLSGKM